jgi:exopolysaccharide biosynthesis polyprenyl glycosylphosphotransferase
VRTAAYWVVRSLQAWDALIQAGILVYVFGDSQHGISLALTVLILPLSQHQMRGWAVYDSHRIGGATEVNRNVLAAQATTFGLCCVLFGLLRSFGALPLLARYFLLSTAVLVATKAVIYGVLRRIRRSGFDTRKVCLIGSWERALAFRERFSRHPQWGMQIACVGVASGSSRTYVDFPTGAPIATDLREVLRSRVIDEVIIATCADEWQSARDIFSLCEEHGVIGRAILDPAPDAAAGRLEDFHGETAFSVVPVRRTDRDLALKRAFDILVASLLLLFTWPLLIAIAVLVKLSSPGPVLFRQKRVGLNGRQFSVLKFRTMLNGADSLTRNLSNSMMRGPIFKDPSDYRVTGVGRILRRFSLDEFPQLFNVLRGDMSIVGPRPLPVYEANQIEGESRRRFSVLPGLTGLWQVSGRNNVTYEAWMKYDLQYVDKWSLWLDAVLLLRTVPAVLSGRGAY